MLTKIFDIIFRTFLTFFFCLVITPIGLFLRLIGKDYLSSTHDKTATTYWFPRHSNSPIRSKMQ